VFCVQNEIQRVVCKYSNSTMNSTVHFKLKILGEWSLPIYGYYDKLQVCNRIIASRWVSRDGTG
jgi:hypothetical protein